MRVYRQLPGPVETNEIIIVSHTGKAAHNVGGMTAHCAFGLFLTQNNDSKGLGPEKLNTLRVKLWNMKLLIIDEISLMGTNEFFSIHSRLCQIFQTSTPFGGKSVIVVGDFYQLRPVGDSFVFMPRKTKDQLPSLVGNYLWQKFVIFELTEIMRQKDDLKFAEALERLALGTLTKFDIEMFQSRCYESRERLPSEKVKSAVDLFKTNDEVDAYNAKRVREITKPQDEKFVSNAIDRVLGGPTKTNEARAIYTLSEMPTTKTYGLPKVVIIHTGIRYMIITNIDVADGLFNGACGITKYIEVNQNSVQAVWIKFDDSSIGTSARSKRKNVSDSNHIQSGLTPVTKVRKSFPLTNKGKVYVCREQFPFVVAEGSTIHKSQGQLMDLLVVTLAKTMEISLLYVALSRATTLKGLYIIGEFKAPRTRPSTDPVILEMNRMKKYCMLVPKYQHLREVGGSILQIVSHNVQSIRSHFKSIRCDSVYMNSHVLLFQETWALSKECYDFPEFAEIVRNNYSGRATARGTIIYAKEQEKYLHRSSVVFKENHNYIEITFCLKNDLKIINTYIHPRTTLEWLQSVFHQNSDIFVGENVLVCGDFNQNMSTEAGIQKLLDRYQLTMISPKLPTTNDLTTIDAVFGKLTKYTADVTIYESIFSFHKPVVIRVSPK